MSDFAFLSFYFYIFDLENWISHSSSCTRFWIFTGSKYKYFSHVKIMCRFHTQDFIQIPKEKKRKKIKRWILLCIRLIYRQFHFHRFRKFRRLVDGISFCCYFFFFRWTLSSSSKKISLVIGKSDEFFWFGYEFESEYFYPFPPPMINTTLCEPRLLCTKRFKPAVWV